MSRCLLPVSQASTLVKKERHPTRSPIPLLSPMPQCPNAPMAHPDVSTHTHTHKDRSKEEEEGRVVGQGYGCEIETSGDIERER